MVKLHSILALLLGKLQGIKADNGDYLLTYRIVQYSNSPECSRFWGELQYVGYTNTGDRTECFALCNQLSGCNGLSTIDDTDPSTVGQCYLYFTPGLIPSHFQICMVLHLLSLRTVVSTLSHILMNMTPMITTIQHILMHVSGDLRRLQARL